MKMRQGLKMGQEAEKRGERLGGQIQDDKNKEMS